MHDKRHVLGGLRQFLHNRLDGAILHRRDECAVIGGHALRHKRRDDGRFPRSWWASDCLEVVVQVAQRMRDDVREALNENLDEYKKRLHETSDQNMDILRAEMKAVVTAQVDQGVDRIAARVDGLVVKMESAAAGLTVAAKKALTAARDDSRDNSPNFFKASIEPTLPRVGVIADELKNEDERAEEIRRSREPGYIAFAPKVPSIFDDEAVLAR